MIFNALRYPLYVLYILTHVVRIYIIVHVMSTINKLMMMITIIIIMIMIILIIIIIIIIIITTAIMIIIITTMTAIIIIIIIIMIKNFNLRNLQSLENLQLYTFGLCHLNILMWFVQTLYIQHIQHIWVIVLHLLDFQY